MATHEIVTDPNLLTVLDASHDARDQALKLVDQIAALNASLEGAAPEAQQEISKQQKLLITNLAQLRGLHRAAHFGARQTKSQTSEARQEVDRLHLQLQNLYYEQRHLQGEIAACESYELVPTTSSLMLPKNNESCQPLTPRPSPTPSPALTFNTHCTDPETTSGIDDTETHDQLSDSELVQELIHLSHTYQHLPLVPLEEFLAAKPECADADENTLMIARIEHERSEREALEAKRMELLKRKQKLIADNKKRKDDLANLDKELEKFIDVRRTWETVCLVSLLTYNRLPNRFRSSSKRMSSLRIYVPGITAYEHSITAFLAFCKVYKKKKSTDEVSDLP